jgi:DNA segregation ATPase FtsK/SpoIIIE and related proteins
MKGGGAKKFYYDIPVVLRFELSDLTRYLSDRVSGARKANIVKTTVECSNRYGPLLFHVVDNLFIRTPVKSLNDHGVSTFFIIPQKVSSLGNKAYYANDRLLMQSVNGILHNIAYSEFEQQLLSDESINESFIEYREYKKEKIEEEKAKLERESDQKLYESWQNLRLSEKAISTLKMIHKNRDKWGFDKWNVDDNLVDKKEFLRSRMRLLNGQSLKSVEKKKNEIEATLRKQILFKPLHDKGAFELTVLFENNLKPYKISAQKVRQINEEGKLFIGRALTGDIVVDWNQQTNHMIVAGLSGSGKSVLLSGLVYQLENLCEEFNYDLVYLTSSSKIADFIAFGKKGATLGTGVDEQIAIFKEVKSILEEREILFAQHDVKNIYEYNNKFSDKKMSHIVLLADEYENSLIANNKEFEPLLIEILNIARSSGAVVLLGSQSILKSAIGTALDKMTVKFSGFNNKNVLNQISPEIADYYRTLERKPQGVFFFNALNLEIKDPINFGSSNYTLVQTPLISGLEENIKQISNSDSAEIELEENNVESLL